MRKHINLENIISFILFFAMIGTVGFVEGENYIGAVISLAVFVGCFFLLKKECGEWKN